MGDVLHILPAVSDACREMPGIKFDWLIDEAFADMASWHPAVDRVIRCAHRRWRKNFWQAYRSGELKKFWRQLRQQRYDVIIDAQSSLKSALFTRLARGLRCGLNARCVREKGAQLAYQRRYQVAKQQHAIERLRQLFAQALGYTCPTTAADFSLDVSRFSLPDLKLPQRYFIIFPNTSWTNKCWPVAHWQALITTMLENKASVLISWGSAMERERAEHLAEEHEQVMVLPRLNLSAYVPIIHGAMAYVSCDTGLGHVAAALNIPGVTLYGPTDPKLIGAIGLNQQHVIADFACAQRCRRTCHHDERVVDDAACMQAITPKTVWQHLQKLLAPAPLSKKKNSNVEETHARGHL